MRRVVKAWVVMGPGTHLRMDTIRPSKTASEAAWTDFGIYKLPSGFKVVRLTYTYDDAKPRTRATQGPMSSCTSCNGECFGGDAHDKVIKPRTRARGKR